MVRLAEEREREGIAAEVLYDLPEWFGIPESTEEYIRESASMAFLAAFEGEEPAGFLAVKRNNPYTAEIYVMGIKKKYQRQGIGRKLYQACYQWCREQGFEYLQVKTLDESHPDEHYALTRKYYLSMGFRPLECFPDLWGKENPCLVMVQYIGLSGIGDLISRDAGDRKEDGHA